MFSVIYNTAFSGMSSGHHPTGYAITISALTAIETSSVVF